MLQDLIMAAFTDGMAKVKDVINSEVGVMTGGLNLAGFPGI
jgi:DNA-binding protein YbaB